MTEGITKYIHIKSTTVYVPSLELGLSHPFSRQRVCPYPRNNRVGGHTRVRVRGWGSLNSNDWRKSLALCLLCGRNTCSFKSLTAPPPHPSPPSPPPPPPSTPPPNALACPAIRTSRTSDCKGFILPKYICNWGRRGGIAKLGPRHFTPSPPHPPLHFALVYT
jgi:hypothetical protein